MSWPWRILSAETMPISQMNIGKEGHDRMPPDETFWAICWDLLTCQRGHVDAALDAELRKDPTIGLPPDVRRALLVAARQLQPEFVDFDSEFVPLLSADDD